MSLNNLANSLSELDRREDALAVAEEAVDLYRRLAAERPDAFTPNLAAALNTLADRLSEFGRPEDALAAAEEAVSLLSPYFQARPLAFAGWMQEMARVYRQLCEGLGREPDAALLAPVDQTFERMQHGCDG